MQAYKLEKHSLLGLDACLHEDRERLRRLVGLTVGLMLSSIEISDGHGRVFWEFSLFHVLGSGLKQQIILFFAIIIV
jgi:hypothetical protein